MIIFIIAVLGAMFLMLICLGIEMLSSKERKVVIVISKTPVIFCLCLLSIAMIIRAMAYLVNLESLVYKIDRGLVSCEEELPRNQECEFNGALFKVIEK